MRTNLPLTIMFAVTDLLLSYRLHSQQTRITLTHVTLILRRMTLLGVCTHDLHMRLIPPTNDVIGRVHTRLVIRVRVTPLCRATPRDLAGCQERSERWRVEMLDFQ